MCERPYCHFGLLFRAFREDAHLSLWQVSVKIPYHLKNVQLIDSGKREPRIGLALNMLAAINVSFGDFFSQLAENASVRRDFGSQIPTITPDFESSGSDGSVAFGTLLKFVREHYALSQVVIAERASYCLRGITKLEHNLQTPLVMSALKLVCATGCDIKWFFDTLEKSYSGA